jgi:PAS domain S-box-containing protein
MSTQHPAQRSKGGRVRRILQSIFDRSEAKPMAQVRISGLLTLAGSRIGRYRLDRPLGEGHTSAVYLATDDSRQAVAIKVLDPERAQREAFRAHFEADIRTVAGISHPNILPVYQFGTSAQGWLYVAMAIATRGTLKQLLERGALDPIQAQHVLEDVAQALQRAHGAGVVHHDVKLSNILFDGSGRVLLGDFGMPRTSYGLLGTPGYIAPEQILGLALDRRADVHALGVVAFEMLTGSSPYRKPSPAETIIATVQEPVPLASDRNPGLPGEVDAVLARALAKVPEERYATPLEFVRDLALLPFGPEPRRSRAAPPAPDAAAEDELFEQSVAKLEEIMNLALTASVMVDETSFVVGWNGLAEQTFGWSGQEILGRSLVTTLIPPKYRELHERGLRRYLETGEGPVLGKKLELSALHRDGHEMPIELSISEAVRAGHRARILSFIRDISQEKLRQQLAGVQASVAGAIEEAGSLQAVAARVLRAIAEPLGWSVGALWLIDGGGRVLRCAGLWQAEQVDAVRFQEMALAAGLGKGEGVPGQVWATGEPAWFEELLSGEDTPRTVAALRSGLRTVAALPILQAGEVRGVVELLASATRRQDPHLLGGLYELGRQLGRAKLAPD